MTIRLTPIEDRLAASAPDASAALLAQLAQLSGAQRTLKDALTSPLSPAAHRHARTQAEAVDAAIGILSRLTQRFRASYGRTGETPSSR
ncbi:EscE/YscE/SsaE family type III secretion system needle protein co-chaperone [Pandoraea iniqua]|uniref:EscE/YscE/SsaE family type III secretion system needle protein co-chaperone n=1 Tax=Pandoraea iniqua TaxID=2508288 RepID=UPI00125AC4DD|nr:EscE/YscE/SsaE family type III secretion system needle protein co-chaperone [Pandoraea iniqua]VVD79734.1 EscE/YscE/SsaE family type III secretion system needle protein co-chaperone [Pandoraea iniqua]